MKPKGYADLAGMNEDDRIGVIGKTITASGAIVAFMVDDDPGKADRYIQKVTTRFPSVKILGRFNGPVPHVITIKASVSQEN